tara:strand:+ start:64 stop:1413 length:1350 start_codon:yes stop_codon:yes gene_type:complete
VSDFKDNAPVPVDWAGQDKRFAYSLKENVDVLTGNRGDPLDRAVTVRDLLDAGIIKLARGSNLFGNNGFEIDPTILFPTLAVPPAPTNLQAAGAFQNILLEWDLQFYIGHAGVEIWRHTSDSLAGATLVGTMTGMAGVYVDAVGSGKSFYYWVRAINKNGVYGPYNSSSGTLGETAIDVAYMLTLLSGAVTSSQLAADLSAPIAKIPALESFTGYSASYSDGSLLTRMGATETKANAAATSAQLSSESTTRASADSALSSTVTSLSSTVGGNTSAISTQVTTTNGLKAQYTVKLDVNGAVAGFGLASTTSAAGNITSEFIVNADRFAIMRGGSNATAATVPFIVQASSTTLNGVAVPAGVYMADAFIKNGSIANAKIGNAAIDNAKIANLSAAKINTGTLNASLVTISGVSPSLNIESASSGARMQIQGSRIRVFDSNGQTRVKLGNLA